MKKYQSYDVVIESINQMVTWLDISATSAKQAQTYKYICPEVDTTQGESYIKASNVRHPLIERIHTNTEFVPNSIQIGGEDQCGMLLYGINFSGKSSYMKSIGVTLIMAQAGLFVPAQSFQFRPFRHIFTRIPSGDNLFKGQSTFVVEMNELRSILKQSNSNSLVIGDEVASGTETVSGIAIVAAAVLSLVKRKVCFIFATHLHEVADIDDIKKNPSIGLYHMSIHYDVSTGVLCYDRILRKGTGSTMYGLEVCQSLDMPPEFIHLANTLRQSYLEISPTIVVPTTSNYSSTIHVDICSICKKPATEVHHIKEQHTADQYGFIDHHHKNNNHNLTVLCNDCHVSIHQEKIQIDGYSMTSNGVKLMISIPDSTKDEKERAIWHPLIDKLIKQGKNSVAIGKELGITTYKVRKYMK
jgi:DNA mismatch repair protein MutS